MSSILIIYSIEKKRNKIATRRIKSTMSMELAKCLFNIQYVLVMLIEIEI